jgi:predicted DNA-binding transcriptional regulator AlpA
MSTLTDIVQRSALPEIMFPEDVALALRIDVQVAERALLEGEFGRHFVAGGRAAVSREGFLASFTGEPLPQSNEAEAPLALDAGGLAALLSISTDAACQLDDSDQLPRPVVIAGRRLWVLSDVRAWLREGTPERSRWETLRRGGVGEEAQAGSATQGAEGNES